MADEPFYAPNRPPASPRQPKPGELLCEFQAKRTLKYWRVELRDCGEWGVEAQFFEDGHFSRSHRFPTRELAIAWAEAERRDLEKGGA
jgi:hypothetical protein